MADMKDYGPVGLRLILGLLFLLPGIMKLMDLFSTGTHMVVGMLWGITALAWILAIVEVLGGLAVLIGWQIKYAVWPLAIVMLGAIVLLAMGEAGIATTNLLFHLLAIAGLLSLFFTGPGKYAVEA